MYHLLLRTGRLSVVEITTVTITRSEKGHNTESGTRATLREGSENQYFQIYGKYFYGAKKQMNIWSRVVHVPLLDIEETKGYLK